MDCKNLLGKIRSDNVITAAVASFLFSFTLLFFGPAVLYYTNIFEFNYTFLDIVLYLIGLALLLGVALSLFLLHFKERLFRKMVCVVFAFGFLFYLQGNILVWSYGLPLTGSGILWGNYLLYGLMDAGIWIIIITISYIKFENMYKFIAILSVFLLLIQAAGFLALMYNAPSEPSWKSKTFDYSLSNIHLSQEKNVIIIVVDAFRSDVFQEIINENEDYKKMFSGFTYYRNSASGLIPTIGSIPSILTGQYYDNSIPYDEFIQESYESSSLPKTLKNSGYNVYIFSNTRMILPSENVSSKIRLNSISVETELNQLYRLTVFRFSPHFIKEFSYPYLIEPSLTTHHENDVGFYQAIKNQTPINQKPVFLYYHLSIPHPPFNLNSKLEYEELPNNISGYKEQARAALEISGGILKNLKTTGVYNQSMVLIIGDHGWGGYGGLNTIQFNKTRSGSIISDIVSESGIPLILVKPFNSNTPLKVSDAPVSLTDIPKTVATELKIENNFPGESMAVIRDSDERKRLFYYILWDTESVASEYLPPMKEFVISNFSWFGDSWEPTYRIYTSQGIEHRYPVNYTFNSLVTFEKNSGSNPYIIDGYRESAEYQILSKQLLFQIWSTGKTAILSFSMDKPHSNGILTLTISPERLKGNGTIQNLIVYVNQYEVGNVTLSQNMNSHMEFYIPQDNFNENVQHVIFYLPNTEFSSDSGVSKDLIDLSEAITTFKISNTTTDGD